MSRLTARCHITVQGCDITQGEAEGDLIGGILVTGRRKRAKENQKLTEQLTSEVM